VDALQKYWQFVPDVGHVPDELQVSKVLPLQLFSVVGVQTALHSPLVTVPLTHVPWALQVWAVVDDPTHPVELGAQTPVQAPPTHAWFVHACAAPQVPVESQVCTPLLVVEHFTALGEHTPVQAPFAQA
jgi:hypothetical protein